MSTVTGLDGCAAPCVHPEKVALATDNAPGVEELARVTSVFKLLGDPTRARMLYALLEAGELCVCDLAAATGTAETTVSQALRLLRASAVVTGRREGRNIYYRLSDAHVRLLLDVTREHALHDGERHR
ncbi:MULTISPECIES: helix-turn-helix transcriptional regulator [Intrasporangiaceae]|jgi:DNA-binding transcriptional ArsR family regulator|uniref:ArsR/SmtB family transcription factor n=1 Tax=Intrasporangiaceae TaxID=85021 RepID=UPI000362D787|nr:MULTISPECIES: metalloregulator ArsR/SmtB family transcription factor [Intrasporangiaceae]KRC84350.1 ArsR family transcriptional regulator [Terrabacter sp. Root85]KRF42399.1 ArsR family transcriptional regulator [Terrabacter sp. Soil811]